MKTWQATNEHHAAVAALALQAADAEGAAVVLFDGSQVGVREWAALGRANFHAFLNGFEPLFALVGDRPISDPGAEQSLRRFVAPYNALPPAAAPHADALGVRRSAAT